LYIFILYDIINIVNLYVVERNLYIVTKVDIEEIKNLEKIGSGGCSVVYKDGNTVYKILKEESKRFYSRYYNKEALENLKSINNDTFVFPDEILENSDGELLGYSMDFIEMDYLRDSIKNLSFEKIERIMNKAEEEVKKLTQNNIMINDMHEANIMYDLKSEEIKIIDTDFFAKNKEMDEAELNLFNNNKFSGVIKDVLGIDIKVYTMENEKINNLVNELGEEKSVSNMINIYIKVLEEEFGKKFNNIGEIQEAFKIRQEELEEQEYQKMKENNIPVIKKILNKILSNDLFKKLPFLNKSDKEDVKLLKEGADKIENNNSCIEDLKGLVNYDITPKEVENLPKENIKNIEESEYR